MNYPWPIFRETSGMNAPEPMACELEFFQIMSWCIQARKYKKILEIGTYKGHTTWAFGRLAKKIGASVVTVDCAPQLSHLNNWDFPVEFRKMYSLKFFEEARNAGEKFDFIFVDGDHSYKSALDDINGALSVLSEEGAIAVHDTVLYLDVRIATRDTEHKIDWMHGPFGKGLAIGLKRK